MFLVVGEIKGQQQVSSIIVSPTMDEVLLNERVVVFIDSTKSENINSVVHQKFKRFNKGYLGLHNNYWLQFNLQNNTSNSCDLWLTFNHSFLDTVVYYERQEKSWVEKKNGHAIESKVKDFNNTTVAFSVQLLPQENKTIYLKVPGTVQIDSKISLLTSKDFLAKSNENKLMFGLFFGLVGALLLYNLFLWVWTRKRYYLYYTLAALTLFLHSYVYDGFVLTIHDLTVSNFWLQFWVCLFTSLAAITHILFVKNILRLKEKAPIMNRVQHIFIFILCLYPLGYLFDQENIWFIQDLSYLTNIFILFGIAVYLSFKKYIPSYYISVSIFIVLISVALDLMNYYNTQGKPSSSWIAEHILLVGIAIEAVFFSLSLASFIKILRQEKEALQIVTGQKEQELHTIREQYTKELEVEVKERTLEVKQQNIQLAQKSKELEQLDEMKSVFFTNLSHELRTPLTLLTGHIQATIDEKYGAISREVKKNLSISQKNGKHILSLINEILELAKLDALTAEVNLSLVKLEPLIEDICEIYHSMLEQNKIDFSFIYHPESTLKVNIDTLKVEKIIHNLISNAVKYTPSEGKISLEVAVVSKTTGHELTLAIQDSGRGISIEDQERVFDRFYQSKHPNQLAEGGTGIGLALAKELTDLMKGSLTVESKFEQGSTFRLTLPVEVSTLKDNDTFETSPTNVSPSSKDKSTTLPHILVVEDNIEMRAFICSQITGDYTIIEASNGKEAIEKLQSYSIDLILSDVMMPEMNGFELLEYVKKTDGFHQIPVLMLTALADHHDKMKALTAGVDDYLTKPFHHDELNARISYLLTNHFERQQWKVEQKQDLADKNEVSETLVKNEVPLNMIHRIQTEIETLLSDTNLSIPQLSEKLDMSQSKLFRETKTATGLSPLQLITEMRLDKARSILEKQQVKTVIEVMNAVGFKKPDYFAKVFKKRFGVLPSSYLGNKLN